MRNKWIAAYRNNTMFKLSFIDLCLSDDETPRGILENNGSYVCLTCGRSFGQKGTANRHYKTMHLESSQAKCHICNKVFKNAVYRNAHRVKEHKITEKMMRQSKLKSSIPKLEPDYFD